MRITFCFLLFHLFGHGILLSQSDSDVMRLSEECVKNYYSLLNSVGDSEYALDEKKDFKEAIIENYGNRFSTIIYNDLNARGSKELKLDEYLDVVINNFPKGLNVGTEIIGTESPKNRSGIPGKFCSVFVDSKVRAGAKTNQKKTLILTVSFDKSSNGQLVEPRITSIALAKRKFNPSSSGSMTGNTEPTTGDDDADLTTAPPAPTEEDLSDDLLNFELVRVPGGKFEIGCRTVNCDNNEKAKKSDNISTFHIMRYEVTNKQFMEFLKLYGKDYVKNGDFKGETILFPNSKGLQRDGNNWSCKSGMENNPIVGVTWYGAITFARFYDMELPSEMQWEFAARNADNRDRSEYPGGNNVFNLAIHQANSDWSTKPVGSKRPNDLDIFDLSGNVWEWVLDWYDKDNYNVHQSAMTNRRNSTLKTLKGGGFTSSEWDCRIQKRWFKEPALQSNEVGFRCVKNL